MEQIPTQATSFIGLTPHEVEQSRAQHGINVLTPPEREPWWKLYLEKFEDPVIRILIIAAVITIAVGFVDGHFAEGVGIVIAIFLATTLAFVNEYRAAREFDVLSQVHDDLPVQVIRSGAYTTVPRKDLVVGDIVLLEEGEEVPADGLVRQAIALQVNESVLTGESLPVRKQVSTMSIFDPDERAFPDDKLFRSTLLNEGRTILEVSAVGDGTVIGHISHQAAQPTDAITPLNAQLEGLSKLIGVVGFSMALLTYIVLIARAAAVGEFVLTAQQWTVTLLLSVSGLIALSRVWLPMIYDALELGGRKFEQPKWLDAGLLSWVLPMGVGVIVFVVGVLLGTALNLIPADSAQWLPADVGVEFLRYFMVAVTIIVVAVPEGLPMSVTLSLAYSMRRMTATNNLVRHMHATETIGAATVICSDKTGTLTLNQMRVRSAIFPHLGESPLADNYETADARFLAESIAANTTANLSLIPGQPARPIGDTTEGALLLWMHERRVDYQALRAGFNAQGYLPFNAEKKYMATMGVSAVDGSRVLYAKGAPEMVLERCTHIWATDGVQVLDQYTRERIETDLLDYQKRGMRELAFAYRTVPLDFDDEDIDPLMNDLIWLGYVAIADPIRPEVPNAVATCRAAGIRVIVVTGDTAETAKEIARQINLWEAADDHDPAAHMTGRTFGDLTDTQAREAVQHLKVLSRARPLDKMRLVNMLQANGEVVAVTGDGTNDAPALNHANVGLAMGSGTDIAKEASDIVLLDDSFRSITNAVMWGRSLYQNIQRFIVFQLTINIAAVGIAFLGPFIGIQFPLTVIQMLWINLVMDTFASLALATEPARWDVMRHAPRKPSSFIITRLMSVRMLSFGLFFVVTLVLFLLAIQQDGEVTRTELSAFYATFILFQFWNLFNVRVMGLNVSVLAGIMENRTFLWIAGAILIGTILIVQFGGDVFRTAPLTLSEWLLLLVVTSPVLLVGEITHWLRKARSNDQAVRAPAA